MIWERNFSAISDSGKGGSPEGDICELLWNYAGWRGERAVFRALCINNGGAGLLTVAFDPSFTGESGYHARSLNSDGGWNVIGCESFMNQPINTYSNEIRSAVLIMHGEAFFNSYMK